MLRTVRFAAGTLLAAGLVALAACGKGTPITAGTATPSPTSPPRVASEYPIGIPNSQPAGVVLASNGAVWFAESRASQIGELAAVSGKPVITSTPTPTKDSGPQSIAAGPNGLLWFTESKVARIGQIQLSTSGFTEFQLGNAKATPMGITLGSDGNMWITDPGTDSIWRINQVGAATQYPIKPGAKPLGITNGPDGALWFTEPGRNKIGRLTIDGTGYAEYPIHSSNAGLAMIIEGSDNALWFTEQRVAKLGRMQVSGQVTNEFSLAPAKSAYGLVQALDGNFYFSDPVGSAIGQYQTANSKVGTYPTITANAKPTSLTLGSESAAPFGIYFSETNANKMGQFYYY